MSADKPLRALHIAPTPFFSDRGCHIRILGMLRGLRTHGVTSTLVTYHHGRDVDDVPARRIGEVRGYQKTSAGPHPLKYWADIKLFWLALKTAWREQPDVIHGHLHEGAMLAWACRACLFWRRTPVLADIQGSLVGELSTFGYFGRAGWVRSIFRGIERFIVWLPTALTCSSQASYSLLRDSFGIHQDKLLLAEDGLDEGMSFERERNTSPDDVTLIYTGSLLPGKGLDELLEVLKAVLTRHSDARAVLVGYPVDTAETFLREAGLLERVELTGQVSYFDLPDQLARADIALDPKPGKAGEGSGKIINYMAAGLPVVCFDTENNRAFFDNQELLAGDIAGFATLIGELIESPERREAVGKSNRERVRMRYDWNRTASDIRDRYRALLNAIGRS